MIVQPFRGVVRSLVICLICVSQGDAGSKDAKEIRLDVARQRLCFAIVEGTGLSVIPLWKGHGVYGIPRSNRDLDDAHFTIVEGGSKFLKFCYGVCTDGTKPHHIALTGPNREFFGQVEREVSADRMSLGPYGQIGWTGTDLALSRQGVFISKLGSVEIVDVDSAPAQREFSPRNFSYISWDHINDHLWFSKDGWLVFFDRKTATTTKVIQGTNPQVSPNSALVSFRGLSGRPCLYQVATGQTRDLDDRQMNAGALLRWSPDGKYVFTAVGDKALVSVYRVADGAVYRVRSLWTWGGTFRSEIFDWYRLETPIR